MSVNWCVVSLFKVVVVSSSGAGLCRLVLVLIISVYDFPFKLVRDFFFLITGHLAPGPGDESIVRIVLVRDCHDLRRESITQIAKKACLKGFGNLVVGKGKGLSQSFP
ncbi:hypothetical protein AVEN_124540-1 [Araneus ventricosus]|uniref:Uncharacterized protein n=1 Tax=Araneus ventricosus TaxID=182803 RepID=A0A4Y2EKC3_ARAVE|nr:hypothetical protein AVEN_24474-1 [Araneus ventricosus]GBM29321.1 hypothetical protein AVEN_124540-1 [Araneus ventricosus]